MSVVNLPLIRRRRVEHQFFKSHKMNFDFEDELNIIPLHGHRGRHTTEYHEWVMRELRKAVGDKTGKEAEDAARGVLQMIRKKLEENPWLPYQHEGF